MVWFSCEDCGDSIKKVQHSLSLHVNHFCPLNGKQGSTQTRLIAVQPKLQAHMSQCSATRLTCIDCNVTFRRSDVKGHTKCVTEHEKYAQGLTKAPGFGGAQHAPFTLDETAQNSPDDASIPQGPPWDCRHTPILQGPEITFCALAILSQGIVQCFCRDAMSA